MESNTNRSDKRAYNPYQDLQAPYRSIYELPTSPEFLFSEESTKHRRSWGENLTFYTGCSYLAGTFAGGSLGLVSGLRGAEPGDTAKLRANRVLNAAGQSGRAWGNRVGVIGLIYAGIESAVVSVTDRDDVWSSVAAGLATGAVYRAAKGVRSAAVAGALGGAVAAAAVAGKQAVKRYAPI